MIQWEQSYGWGTGQWFSSVGGLNVPVLLESIRDYPYKAEHEMIAKAMKEYGIETVDLLNAFTGHQLSGLIMYKMNRHYDEGNRLIAVALGNHLKPKVSDRPQQL